MKYFAHKLGYGDEAEFWGIVGLLHDLDFELYPEEHCIKEQEIMRERGIDERIIFKSVENVNLDTVIAYKQKGEKHHFLDTYM